MDKKGSMGLIAIIIILVLAIFTIYLVSIAQRNCNSNKDCAENAYCGTDYECHQFPQEIVTDGSSYTGAAIILGLSLILSAYIFRTGNIPFIKKRE